MEGLSPVLKPVALLSLLVLIVGVACSSGGDSDEAATATTAKPITLNLGVVQSQTGAAAIYGKTALNGIELAIKQHEDANLQIQYTVVDDLGTNDGGIGAFNRLADLKVNAIIGPTLSGVAQAAFKVAQEKGIPSIGATTTADGITTAGDQIFRTALAESTVVPPTIAAVNGKAPIKQAVLVFDSTDTFSTASAAAMRKGIQGINGKIVLEVDVSKDKDVVGAIKGVQDPVDTILVTPLINESGPIVKSIRDGGLTQTIVGGNSFNTLDMVTASGGAVNGAYVGAAWNPAVDSAASKKFVADYTAAYGSAPDLYAAQGYAAVEVLVAAVQKAGSADNAALRSALASAKDVETIFGKISMNSTREAEYAPVVQQFQDGKLIVVK
jgi:branched-chain amino acid transport system substrate-binding protein